MNEWSWYQTLVFALGTGIIGTALGAIWKFSKRDAKIDISSDDIKKLFTSGEKTQIRIGISEEKINSIEKEFIEIRANQKSLIHSIDSQNRQVLNFIDRLEKNHDMFISSQKNINEKLEASIDAIKNTLINSGHSSCIFYKKSVADIKQIVGTDKA
jgi:hypothetical protein